MVSQHQKGSEALVDDHLAEVIREFAQTATLADKIGQKWKVKGRLICGSTWAFHGDDGKIKVIAVVVASNEDGPNVHANKLFNAAEWAIRCGTNLAIVIGNRSSVIKHGDIIEVMSGWVPYVGPSGVVVPVAIHFGPKVND